MDGPQDLGLDDPVGRVQVEERHEHAHRDEKYLDLPLEVAGRPLFGLHEFFGFLEGLLADPHFQPGDFPPGFLNAPVGHRLLQVMRRVTSAASVLQPTRLPGSPGKRPPAGA